MALRNRAWAQSNPAFRPLFENATTRKGIFVVLINEPPRTDAEPEAANPCFWWRRGKVGCLLFDNDCASSLTWCGSIGFEPRPSNVDREMG